MKIAIRQFVMGEWSGWFGYDVTGLSPSSLFARGAALLRKNPTSDVVTIDERPYAPTEFRRLPQ
jgi:hypothetical protein